MYYSNEKPNGYLKIWIWWKSIEKAFVNQIGCNAVFLHSKRRQKSLSDLIIILFLSYYYFAQLNVYYIIFILSLNPFFQLL
jgi:hypothetical protein